MHNGASGTVSRAERALASNSKQHQIGWLPMHLLTIDVRLCQPCIVASHLGAPHARNRGHADSLLLEKRTVNFPDHLIKTTRLASKAVHFIPTSCQSSQSITPAASGGPDSPPPALQPPALPLPGKQN